MLATHLFGRFPSCFPLTKCLTLMLLVLLPGPEIMRAGNPVTHPVAYVDLISPVSITP